MSLNRNDLSAQVSAKSGLTKKDSAKAIAALIDSITEALKAGNSIRLTGFGTFKVVKRAQRKGRNPQTGEELVIPEHDAPFFAAGKPLREEVAGK